jgi:hypothetical protein
MRAVFPNAIAEARGQRGNFRPNCLRRLGVDLKIDIALRDQAEQAKSEIGLSNR